MVNGGWNSTGNASLTIISPDVVGKIRVVSGVAFLAFEATTGKPS